MVTSCTDLLPRYPWSPNVGVVPPGEGIRSLPVRAGRRVRHSDGERRAIVALGHTILVTPYHLLAQACPYADLVADHCDPPRSPAPDPPSRPSPRTPRSRWSWRGERAPLTVTKGIGTALARIAAQHPALGARLSATVRPGCFCVYVPDPRQPIRWESY
jgi:hypothetical protein